MTKGAKNIAGLGKGILGSLDNFVSDPAELKTAFKGWLDNINSTPITGPQIQNDVVQPFMDNTKFVRPNITDAGALSKVQKLQDYGKAAGTSLGYLYGLRKTLGDVDNSIAQPMREAIDTGLNKYADTQGLTDYTRYKQAEAVNDATANMGNKPQGHTNENQQARSRLRPCHCRGSTGGRARDAG